MSTAYKLSPDAEHALRPFRSVSVIGLGYIGLPTAATLAARGIPVHGVDINQHAIDTINRGDIHIVEPLLDLTVRGAVQSGLLKASLEHKEADAFLIAVPTPLTGNKSADLSFVLAAGKAIAPVLKRGDLVVLESTSPVGTTEQLVEQLRSMRSDLVFPRRGDDGSRVDINVTYCPERVLPGRVIEELVSNDRAIGGMTPACTARAISLYRLFVRGELIPTDSRSAELCKLAENAYRDVNIAFANELSNVCDELDMNVWEVIRLANRHPRVKILKPGVGVGGHCIAVDPWFIVEAAPKETSLITAARRVNDLKPHRVFERIKKVASSWSLETNSLPTIALLGLSFKPNVDDIRESPALEVAEMTLKAGIANVLVVEPHISSLPRHLDEAGLRLHTLEEAKKHANIFVHLVDHDAFHAFMASQPTNELFLSACREH